MTVWCCVASGPSLTLEDVEALQGRARVLAVNDSYRMAPWADALYAADLKWWHVHHAKAAPDFDGRMYTIDPGDANNPFIGRQLYGLKVWRQDRADRAQTGLSQVPGVLRLGGLSGYQAINAAYLWGAKVILLLGYDMQVTRGQLHWFGNHPAGLANTDDYGKRIKHFATIEPAKYGIEIVNCSRETALNCFPRLPIDEALERYSCAA